MVGRGCVKIGGFGFVVGVRFGVCLRIILIGVLLVVDVNELGALGALGALGTMVCFFCITSFG